MKVESGSNVCNNFSIDGLLDLFQIDDNNSRMGARDRPFKVIGLRRTNTMSWTRINCIFRFGERVCECQKKLTASKNSCVWLECCNLNKRWIVPPSTVKLIVNAHSDYNRNAENNVNKVLDDAFRLEGWVQSLVIQVKELHYSRLSFCPPYQFRFTGTLYLEDDLTVSMFEYSKEPGSKIHSLTQNTSYVPPTGGHKVVIRRIPQKSRDLFNDTFRTIMRNDILQYLTQSDKTKLITATGCDWMDTEHVYRPSDYPGDLIDIARCMELGETLWRLEYLMGQETENISRHCKVATGRTTFATFQKLESIGTRIDDLWICTDGAPFQLQRNVVRLIEHKRFNNKYSCSKMHGNAHCYCRSNLKSRAEYRNTIELTCSNDENVTWDCGQLAGLIKRYSYVTYEKQGYRMSGSSFPQEGFSPSEAFRITGRVPYLSLVGENRCFIPLHPDKLPIVRILELSCGHFHIEEPLQALMLIVRDAQVTFGDTVVCRRNPNKTVVIANDHKNRRKNHPALAPRRSMRLFCLLMGERTSVSPRDDNGLAFLHQVATYDSRSSSGSDLYLHVHTKKHQASEKDQIAKVDLSGMKYKRLFISTNGKLEVVGCPVALEVGRWMYDDFVGEP